MANLSFKPLAFKPLAFKPLAFRALGAVATKAPQLPPDDNLFAHWDFDDTLLDRVSLLTPTQYGTGGFVGGISGRGQNFVYATKDYLKLPTGAMASIANGTGFTLSLWFKADSDQMYANPRLFTIAETNLNFTLGLQGTAPNPLNPVVRYANTVKYSPATPVSQGEWHHIVVRVNSLTAMDITLWLDGVLCTDWVTGGITGNAVFNALGAYDGTGYGWTGAIDEVRVYNTKAITDDHVRALYLNPGGSSKNVAPESLKRR